MLFVGNSYTYYNSMPQLFAAMVEHSLPGHKVETKFIGGGGATLEKHWEVGQVQEALKDGGWDFVVLQEQSMLGADDLTHPDSPKQFFKYAELLHGEIASSGAETVFFLTWSRKHLKEQQIYLTDAYTKIAQKLGSTLAPVGLVWDSLREDPALELYMEDGSHPSVTGSFVAAMTLAATIFDVRLNDVPGELYGYEILRGGALSDEKTALSNLPANQVQRIERAVMALMQE